MGFQENRAAAWSTSSTTSPNGFTYWTLAFKNPYYVSPGYYKLDSGEMMASGLDEYVGHYWSNEQYYNENWLINSSIGAEVFLSQGARVLNGAWSPDGRYFAFTADAYEDASTYRQKVYQVDRHPNATPTPYQYDMYYGEENYSLRVFDRIAMNIAYEVSSEVVGYLPPSWSGNTLTYSVDTNPALYTRYWSGPGLVLTSTTPNKSLEQRSITMDALPPKGSLFSNGDDIRNLDALKPADFNLAEVPATAALAGNDAVTLPSSNLDQWNLAPGGPFLAGLGNDTVSGGSLGENVAGGQGDDRLIGGGGNDILQGGLGNDTLFGGPGNDNILAGPGHDSLLGGAGDDAIAGGLGNDTIQVGTGGGNDDIRGGEDSDGKDQDLVLLPGRPTDYTIEDSLIGVTLTRKSDGTKITVRQDVEKVTFAELGDNAVAVPNQWIEMARLSYEAYKAPNASPPGTWRPMFAAELGMEPGGSAEKYGFDVRMVGGVYEASGKVGHPDAAAAKIYTGQVDGAPTLALVFRGTDDDDDWTEYPTFTDYFERFRPLVDAVKDYVKENNIQKVFVTGHSLGGAMAQMFMQESGVYGDGRYVGATFGSPGAPLHRSDNRILHFEHTQDVVPHARGIATAVFPALALAPEATKLVGNVPVLQGGNYFTSGEIIRLPIEPFGPEAGQPPGRPEGGSVISTSEHSMRAYWESIYNLGAVEPGLTGNLLQGATRTPGGITAFGAGDGNANLLAGDNAFQVAAEVAAGGALANLKLYADDRLFGMGGDDLIIGYVGDDELWGQAGNDTIAGGQGNDLVFGGEDNDSLLGALGADFLGGGQGDDTLLGGQGADTLQGGLANDSLVGARDNDDLRGGAGDDTLVGGEGSDKLRGADGADVFQFSYDDLPGEADAITDFSPGEDRIDLSRLGSLKLVPALTGTAQVTFDPSTQRLLISLLGGAEPELTINVQGSTSITAANLIGVTPG